MRKQLLTAAAVMAGVAMGTEAGAQAWTQNFNAGLPATWTMYKGDNNVISTSLVAAIQTKLAAQAWMGWPRAAGDSCMITTSWFSPAGKADRWLITPAFQVTSPNMVLSWEDYASDATYSDSVQVLISTSAGTTPGAFSATLYNAEATKGGFSKKGVSLGAYNGQTIRMAFRNNSFDKAVLMIDNAAAEIVANALDAKAESVVFPTLAANGASVSAVVSNAGATNITSMTVTYQVDANAPVSQTFSSMNLGPFAKAQLNFSTPITGLSAGAHTLKVTITQVNGANDPVASNNTVTKNFSLASSTTQRNGLMEEFTSSTCAPCASFNATFDPLLQNNNVNVPSSRFNIIKYQMNWPAPGNDVSYNAHGLTRRNYYSVSGIPDHYTNGKPGGSGNQAEIDNSKTTPAYMDISGTYQIRHDSIFATVTVTPRFTVSGANYKLHMAATEKHYTNNGATTTQKQYYHVMRRMLPDGNGTTITSFTDGQPVTFKIGAPWTAGSVTQNSFNFWANPIGSNLVVFVQDDNSKDVLQSMVIPSQWSTGVENVAGTISSVAIFPNPAQDYATLAFNLSEAQNVQIQVVDALGRTVHTLADQRLSAGTQEIVLPTANFAAGLYHVKIQTEQGAVTERLSVVK